MGLKRSQLRAEAGSVRIGAVIPIATIAVAIFLYFLFSASGDFEFIDLWLTVDQQGRYFYEQGNYSEAAIRFEDPLWKGTAFYMDGQYAAAIGAWATLNTAEGYFNMGNASARSGTFEQAVQNYDIALSIDPDYTEARENRELVLRLIQNQKDRKEEEVQEATELGADDVQFDEKGEKGEKGELKPTLLTDEQISEMWLRQIQTTPAQFLKSKFAIQAQVEQK